MSQPIYYKECGLKSPLPVKKYLVRSLTEIGVVEYTLDISLLTVYPITHLQLPYSTPNVSVYLCAVHPCLF